jgi:hypothetical protein
MCNVDGFFVRDTFGEIEIATLGEDRGLVIDTALL